MLARLLLSKVLNFLKSSRLVFATMFMLSSVSCVVTAGAVTSGSRQNSNQSVSSLHCHMDSCAVASQISKQSKPAWNASQKPPVKPNPIKGFALAVPQEKFKRVRTHPL